MKKLFFVISVFMIICTFNITARGSGTSTYAQSAVLMEMRSGRILYEQNANERLLTASIAKIMTAITAIENGYIDEYVEISDEATKQIGSSIYLVAGDKVKLEDLIYGLLLRSGNDAAYAIAETVGEGDVDKFIYLMNETAKKIGMTNSTFENPSGLDEKTKNYSTAYDMALLTQYAYQNETFRKIFGAKVHKCETYNGNVYSFYNKHRLVTGKDYVTGGKTGFTKAAHRTLVTTASINDLDLVAVTFNDGNDWNDHQNLFNYANTNFQNTLLVKRGFMNLGAYDVRDSVFISESIYYPIKTDGSEEYKMIVKILNNYRDEDTIIGKVELYLENKIIYQGELKKYKSSTTFGVKTTNIKLGFN